LVECSTNSHQQDKFDEIVGCLEDILMEDEFQDMQHQFMTNNMNAFEQDEENKLEYMTIFKDYTYMIEAYLTKHLQQRLDWFSMPAFIEMIRKQPEQCEGDVFEMMASLGDFNLFKELILAHKQQATGKGHNFDFLTITKK
ncbi:ADP-ribosylation factor-like 2-binding protein, partial [Gorgonomyces haynaldii]